MAQETHIVQQDHARLLDRIYGTQKHIYDFTRKYYLFGRDQVLERIIARNPQSVLEIGCGTARNLRLLARRLPTVELYGIDASREMLSVATSHLMRDRISSRARVSFGLAEQLMWEHTFPGAPRPEVVLFSYSLSMIPQWAEAIERSLEILAPGGVLYVVDFWDLHSYPAWCQSALKAWLRRFHVEFRPEHLEFIRQLNAQKDATGSCQVSQVYVEGVLGSYAYIASVEKARG